MRVISQQQIADLFGVSKESIDTWQKLGMPVEIYGGPGVPSEYDSAKCIKWRVETEVHKAQGERPQNWLAREQAIAKSMDNAERRKVLIRVEEVEPAMKAAFIAAREYWRNEPTRLAREVPGKPIKEIEELLAAAFDAFLAKLSRWPIQQQEEDDDESADVCTDELVGDSHG